MVDCREAEKLSWGEAISGLGSICFSSFIITAQQCCGGTRVQCHERCQNKTSEQNEDSHVERNMRTRLHLGVRGICCEKFTPTKCMYELHNSNRHHRSTTVRGSHVHLDDKLTDEEEVEIMDELITLYFEVEA